MYLGSPYTKCIGYPGYTEMYCRFEVTNFFIRLLKYLSIKKLQRFIALKCGCVPDFIPKIYEIFGDSKIPPCNFFQMSSCPGKYTINKIVIIIDIICYNKYLI